MKVEIDARGEIPMAGRRAFFAIRFFPNTNAEAADLEWGLILFKVKDFVSYTQGGVFSYVVHFEEKEKE